MKYKYILFALMIIGIAGVVQADPRVKAASPAVYVDMETPFRCVPPTMEKQISDTIVLTPDDFSFVPLQTGDLLPRYAVNGYNFTDKPLDDVLCKLLEPAGITVKAPVVEYNELTGRQVRGELSSVVEQLVDAGDMFYTYKDSTKTLTLLQRAEFGLNVPKNKVVLMAVLDALRGSQITDLSVDWEKYQIRMIVAPEELKKAKALIDQILNDSYLLAAEIQGYQAVPLARTGWQGVLNRIAHKLATIGRAVVGRSVVLSSKSKVEDFMRQAAKTYQLDPIVAGEAVVPNGWQMRFNVNECANYRLPFPQMFLVLKTHIKNEQTLRTQVTLYSGSNVMTSFDVPSSLNQEVVLLGLPTKVGQTEMLFLLRFDLVRFVKKGE